MTKIKQNSILKNPKFLLDGEKHWLLLGYCLLVVFFPGDTVNVALAVLWHPLSY